MSHSDSELGDPQPPKASKKHKEFLVSVNLPKAQKSPAETERFIRLLNKTIIHPEEIQNELLNNEARKGRIGLDDMFRQGTSSCFGSTVNPDVYSDSVGDGRKESSSAEPIIQPHMESRMLHDKSFLSETILHAEAAMLHFEQVFSGFNVLADQFELYNYDVDDKTHMSELQQFRRFCEQLQMVTEPTVAGFRVLDLTSDIGLRIALEFLQKPKCMLVALHEASYPFPYDGPTLEENMVAKSQINHGHDVAIQGFGRLDKSGFKGGQSIPNDQNKDVSFFPQLEEIVQELLQGCLHLSKWADTVISVYKTLVHTDKFEKRHLWSHVKCMKPQDQADVTQRIIQIREVNRRLFLVVNGIDHTLINIRINLDYFELNCKEAEKAKGFTGYSEDSASYQQTTDDPWGTGSRLAYTSQFDSHSSQRPILSDEEILMFQNMRIMEEVFHHKVKRLGESIVGPKRPTCPLDDPPRRNN